jgi:uncharacterized OB-fold protein
MVTMQPYVKMWYDHLAQGRIMGLQCSQCRGYEFPPVPICSTCSSFDLDWVPMSGKGQMTAFKVPLRPDPEFASLWPYLNGVVALEEGLMYGGMVVGVGPDDFEWLYDALPVAVEADIGDRSGTKFLAFHLSR